MMGNFVFKSFIKDIEREMERERKKSLRKSVKPLVAKIRSNIDQNFQRHTGNLRKGIAVEIQRDYVLVGIDAKIAPHGLLMELGSYRSGIRYTTGEGSKPAGVSSGRLVGRPYFLTAYQSTESQLIDLLSREWNL